MITDLPAEVVQVDYDVGDSRTDQDFHGIIDQCAPADGQQRLGHTLGQRPQSHAETGRKNHSFGDSFAHGVRGAARSQLSRTSRTVTTPPTRAAVTLAVSMTSGKKARYPGFPLRAAR